MATCVNTHALLLDKCESCRSALLVQGDGSFGFSCVQDSMDNQMESLVRDCHGQGATLELCYGIVKLVHGLHESSYRFFPLFSLFALPQNRGSPHTKGPRALQLIFILRQRRWLYLETLSLTNVKYELIRLRACLKRIGWHQLPMVKHTLGECLS